MKIAVTGPREPFRGTGNLVDTWVDSLPADTHLFHGNAKGVDRMARDRARGRGLKVTSIEPSYKDFPTTMAPLVPLVRNAELISNVDDLTGFWHGADHGGTLNTLWVFQKLFKRRPQWILIDPMIGLREADIVFDRVCKSPPSHWLQALNLWRQSVNRQPE